MDFMSLSFCSFCVSVFLVSIVGAHESYRNEADLSEKISRQQQCDLFQGSWIYDDQAYPLYDSCPFIRKEFDCKKYGRPDDQYLKYRWQPKGCNLPRFDGVDFLNRFRGKKMMFIGDSLSLNFWNSFVCLLHAVDPQAPIIQQNNETISTFTFQNYDVTVSLFHSVFLVDVIDTKVGRVLKLDSMQNGDLWKTMDVLIFNTYQWWGRTGPKQPWDYIQDGRKIYKDMNRTLAFIKGLDTWAKWVDAEVDQTKTKVFFQGLSPSHYKGNEWNEPGVTNCAKETEPLEGSKYPGGILPATKIVNDALSTIKEPVYLLDTTTLSQLRKDGHPSSYNGFHGMDCTHWCIPGVPDTWSQILYAVLSN